MHEAAIANMILSKSIGSLAESFSGRISRIVVEIGQFRNVDPESLNFAFNSLKRERKETEDAGLEILEVIALAKCTGKGHLYHPDSRRSFCCDKCEGEISQLLKGKELNIINVEVEIEEPECLPNI